MGAETPARLERQDDQLAVSGDWTRLHVRDAMIEGGFADPSAWLPGSSERALQIDASRIGALDTLGCLALADLVQGFENAGYSVQIVGISDDKKDLFSVIQSHSQVALPQKKPFALDDSIAALGRVVSLVWSDFMGIVAMLGLVLGALFSGLIRPRKWRINAFVSQLDKAGLRAVPIIVLIQLVIGGIIAQQSAWQLRYFGAELFTVDLVAILVLREIGVLISAIMVAGRTGSALTAEIGAMRMREEVDAMRVMGLDPADVLIVPRVLGLIVALPLLTIIANGAALVGGMLTVWAYSGIEPVVFIDRMQNAIVLSTVLVGLIKAPFMALVIGCIACYEGFRVSGSTESLGERVTAAVVKAIFAVIVMDGVFAMFFASINF